MTGHEQDGLEELSSDAVDGDPRPRWSTSFRVAVVLAACAAAVVTVGVRSANGNRQHQAQLRRLDRIDVSVQLGSANASADPAGRVTSASVEVVVNNRGQYPIYLQRPQVQMPGISAVDWAPGSRQVPGGSTEWMHLRYRVTCPVVTGPVPAGRLVVVLRSAAGRTHRLITSLSGGISNGDPLTSQLDQVCGALDFGSALDLADQPAGGRSAALTLHNLGRTTLRVRQIEVEDRRVTVTVQPGLPETVPAHGERRVTLTFTIRSCGNGRPPTRLDLFVSGDNDEQGSSTGSAALSDDGMTRLIQNAFRHDC